MLIIFGFTLKFLNIDEGIWEKIIQNITHHWKFHPHW